MKKIISYSIYNKRPKDILGLICNCILSKFVYPSWSIYIYYDNTIPRECIQILKSFDNVEMKYMNEHWLTKYDKMMWRFLAIDDADIVICRDGDSWISKREEVCVNEWLESDKIFHIIRDHCYHSKEIMGGMWGMKKIKNFSMEEKLKNMIEKYSEPKINDQTFLKLYIYDILNKDDIFIHTGKQFAMNDEGKPWLPGKEIWKTGGYFPEENIKLIPEYCDWDEWIPEFSFKKINALNKFLCAHCLEEHDVLIGNILEHYPKNTIKKLEELFNNHGYDLWKVDFNPPISIK